MPVSHGEDPAAILWRCQEAELSVDLMAGRRLNTWRTAPSFGIWTGFEWEHVRFDGTGAGFEWLYQIFGIIPMIVDSTRRKIGVYTCKFGGWNVNHVAILTIYGASLTRPHTCFWIDFEYQCMKSLLMQTCNYLQLSMKHHQTTDLWWTIVKDIFDFRPWYAWDIPWSESDTCPDYLGTYSVYFRSPEPFPAAIGPFLGEVMVHLHKKMWLQQKKYPPLNEQGPWKLQNLVDANLIFQPHIRQALCQFAGG